MVAGLGQGTSSGTHHLRVAGQDLFKSNVTPLDLEPVRWEDAGGAVAALTWVVEDTTSNRTMPGGANVRLDVNGTRVFGGTLVRRSFERLPVGRVIRCTAVSYDSWLDWRIVPQWANRADLGNRVRKLTSERAVVQDLIERRGGPLRASSATVVNTNTSMDLVRVERQSLREALDLIAEEAEDDGAGRRRYYVDEQMRLHWFPLLEGTAAPYRISDGSYIRNVLATAGLVEYWSLREEGGTTAYGSQGVANLTKTGTITAQTRVGVVNEPAYRASTFTTTSYAQKTSAPASLFPGDTFTLELWFRRSGVSGTTEYLLISSNGSDDGYQLTITAANKLRLYRRNLAQDFLTTGTYTDTNWHHLACVHSPGNTEMVVDGVSVAGTETPQVFGSGATTFSVGLNTASLVGDIQHVAVYSTDLSLATIQAHYNQGISIVAEDLTLDDDWTDVVHHVYVVGKDRDGSGWVYNTGSDFELGAVQAFHERPRSDTAAERRRAGKGYQRRHSRVRSGSFTTMEVGAWRVGQTLTITDSAFGLSADTFLVSGVRGELQMGGTVQQSIDYGSLRRSLVRHLRQGSRR